LKNARERMDIISAYREVGSYRGAAAVCRTTPKTVERIIERHEAGGRPPARKDRGHNYDPVTELVEERIRATSGRISAKRLLPAAGRRGIPAHRGTSAGWSRKCGRRGGGAITAAAGRGCGHRATR
jgi:Homeodomain-like domain-containing protein